MLTCVLSPNKGAFPAQLKSISLPTVDRVEHFQPFTEREYGFPFRCTRLRFGSPDTCVCTHPAVLGVRLQDRCGKKRYPKRVTVV